MVSRKRLSYANLPTDSSEADSDDQQYIPQRHANGDSKRKGNSYGVENKTLRQRCYSKNALMARENRQRKKKYIQGLENDVSKLKHDNKTLKSILDNQSHVIKDLRKEVQYLKSVLANSSDITILLKNINKSTGMSVTTSLDKRLTLQNNYGLKNEAVHGKTAHPWEESNGFNCYSFSKPMSPLSPSLSDIELGNLNDDSVLPDINQLDSFSNALEFEKFESEAHNCVAPENPFMEHNYTAKPACGDDVGICLHVSKHRVSLEFCPSCSEAASRTWDEIE